MSGSSNKRFHDHTGHMIFTDRFAYCSFEGCEMHWTRGEHGWIPDDDDRSYRGKDPKPKYNYKGKKNWKRKG